MCKVETNLYGGMFLSLGFVVYDWTQFVQSTLARYQSKAEHIKTNAMACICERWLILDFVTIFNFIKDARLNSFSKRLKFSNRLASSFALEFELAHAIVCL